MHPLTGDLQSQASATSSEDLKILLEDINAVDQETPTDRIIAKQDVVSISQSTDIAMDKLCVYIQAFNGLFLLTISPLNNPRETLN